MSAHIPPLRGVSVAPTASARGSHWTALFTGANGGMLLMIVSTALFSAMHGVVRYVSADLHPFEVAFFRNVFGLVLLFPLLLRAGRAALITHQPKLQILRGLVGVVAMLSWFYALSVAPIADATALSFLAAIFASIGAVVFLKERMGVRRVAAVVVSFAGALIILRPGAGALQPGALFVLLSSVAWGVSLVIVKRLAQTDTTVSIVAWMTVMMTGLSLIPALLTWVTPSLAQLGWLALMGALATAGTLAMTQAMRLAEATVVLPLDFTRLIWTSVIGFVFFAEVPDMWTGVGGAIIFACASYIAYRESRLAGEAAVEPTESGRQDA